MHDNQLDSVAPAVVVRRQAIRNPHSALRRRAFPATEVDGIKAFRSDTEFQLEVGLAHALETQHLELTIEQRLGVALPPNGRRRAGPAR